MPERKTAKKPKPKAHVAEAPAYSAVERLIRLRQEADRIVAELFGPTPGAAADAAPPQGPRVPVDVYEQGDAFWLSLEVPGVQRPDLSLSVVGQALVLEGRKREEAPVGGDGVAFECAERAYGPFRRVIELPGAADTSRLEARLARGVLEVRLPRIRERRGRRREVPIG